MLDSTDRRCKRVSYCLLLLFYGCFRPVDENPEVDGGRDAAVEVPVTSFIAPVPLDDLGESEFAYWQGAIWNTSLRRPWREISWTDTGEFLIDAVGGVVLRDAGYISAANDEWRTWSHATGNSFPHWTRWHGDWYRFTYSGDPFYPQGPMRVWRLNRATKQLELTATRASEFDAGFSEIAFVSAAAVWGGTQWWVADGVWDGLGTYSRAHVFIASDLNTIPAVPTLDAGLSLLADGVDGDTRLIWAVNKSALPHRQTLLRFRGADVTSSVIDAGFCSVPYVQSGAPITMGCVSDGGIEVWVADRDGARIIGWEATQVPMPHFLARLQPLRMLFQQLTDAGTSAMLNSCDSARCVELLETCSAPMNAGVDDAGALYVADYLLDAGVRVTRFAPGAW